MTATSQPGVGKPPRAELNPALISTVQRSYGTCCLKREFFDDFYRSFVASSPAVAAKFVNTDMQKQKALLRSSISLLIMYAGGNALGKAKIQELGKSHSRRELDIGPQMYGYWLASFLDTVKKHDPQADQGAWRQVLNLGIEAMKARY
jgi:hypothetical protein